MKAFTSNDKDQKVFSILCVFAADKHQTFEHARVMIKLINGLGVSKRALWKRSFVQLYMNYN